MAICSCKFLRKPHIVGVEKGRQRSARAGDAERPGRTHALVGVPVVTPAVQVEPFNPAASSAFSRPVNSEWKPAPNLARLPRH
jgi:hypothetical protein